MKPIGAIIDNGIRSPRALLAAVVRKLNGELISRDFGSCELP
jgi:hypothetical protein